MKILVTGGTGFIGSHTTAALINQGHEVVIADNLSNSGIGVLQNIAQITGKTPKFYKIDVCDKKSLGALFDENSFDAAIHFAGFKAVAESVEKPLEYYRNNIMSTISLLETMLEHGVLALIFSSSATVYGSPAGLPIKEDFPLSAFNPYGETKLMNEKIITDFQRANPAFSATLLRYFNPIGAHESGLLGENPSGIPNNLMPLIIKSALGEIPLKVCGTDYETPDGTGVRDYIHVLDLAAGHAAALKNARNPGIYTYNLGTGKGLSVLELISAFERVNGVKVNYSFAERRPGDIAACYADPSKAKRELGFTALRGVDEMCRDAWNYASKQNKK